ncbi:unnamed protein product [Bursaphelenchus xylophilus]|uniref:(pine wood nematode) hypothetical protein n=1 Tax=Bursaphelenchus xylophilus TaxID=6326 RepID=A0A7I8WYV4_BURXY|nr:unnamed protein product [Bursaphelenchus xylophilus]CAG9101811.1 unnamed protein product [Bursaphelenchus xylophilus]
MNSQTLLMLCCTLALQFAYYVDAAAFLRQDKDKSAPAVVENANQQYISPEVAHLLLEPQVVQDLLELQSQYRPGQEQVVESAPEAELPAQKRAQTFVRFGKRAQTFVRFGKRAQTFVRFARLHCKKSRFLTLERGSCSSTPSSTPEHQSTLQYNIK